MSESLNNAIDLDIGSGFSVIKDRVSSLEPDDLYRVNLGGHSSFNIALKGLTADADIALIQDKNSNGTIDSGEIIANSTLGGKNAESINTLLDGGIFYIQVYPYGNAATEYDLSVKAVPWDDAGNSLETARTITIDSAAEVRDWIGAADTQDYYEFELDKTSNLNVKLTDLTADADVRLLDAKGNIITGSANSGITNESISRTLAQGPYYVQVSPSQKSQTFYNLSVATTPLAETSEVNPSSVDQPIIPISVEGIIPQATPNDIRYIAGTLRADTFTYESGKRNIFSGNGNVDFGTGARDLLDLSMFTADTVSFNYANATDGGVVYNPGNGDRLFDAITLSDGSQVLFENIETIKFADTIYNLSVTPNDPLFNSQWDLHMTGVHNAWRLTTGNKDVLVGIADTGLGTDSNGKVHPDLRPFESMDNNYLDESESFSHGTLIQGQIAAAANNKIGGAGINWAADVMSIDVVGDEDDVYNLADATQAMIDRANSQGQRLVVNMSLAGGKTEAFEELISENQDKALFVMSAGNGDQDSIISPADLSLDYDNVIAVGSVWGTQNWYGDSTNPGDRASYADWWGSNTGEGLDLMAPTEVLSSSATRSTTDDPYEFSYIDKFNGTSSPTAIVTGVASLVWSVNQSLSATQIQDILLETAYDLGEPGYDTDYGYGIVNADAAVRQALALDRVA